MLPLFTHGASSCKPMFIEVDTSDPRPIYQQIVSEIERAVSLGAVRAGDPLPSARQLAVDLRINPNTAKQAIRELERRGIAEVRRGLGTYVSADARPRTRA